MIKMKTAGSKRARKLPEPLHFDNQEDAKMLSPMKVAKFSAGWEMKNPNLIGFAKYKEWFPYILKAEKPGESFTFSFKGSMFGFFDRWARSRPV